jgi:C_GCAxxG_C_C family probable redox protein
MAHTRRVANGRFARGFNCAQSVFAAFADRLDVSTEFALRLAAPFGGGMARRGDVCGALSGALMVLGLQYASDRPEGKEEIYKIAREFIDEFEQEHGGITCKELLGYNISTPKGLQAAKDHNAFASVCPALVNQTARTLAKYLSDHPPMQA